MVPRKVGSAWEVDAPAKLNLYLEVLGKRSDGFHELETLLLPVRVYDELRWTRSPPIQFKRASPQFSFCFTDQRTLRSRSRDSGAGDDVNLNDDNLVVRAAKHLASHAGIEPQGHFHLTKRIPIQAGMGGGSSDAAAALVLANRCWDLNYSPEQLATLAADLGSDIPFFLHQGPAVCRGRGERVEPVTGLPRLHFVVVQPPTGLSTASVFGQLAQESNSTAGKLESGARLKHLIDALRRGAMAEAGRACFNRLENAAATFAPGIRRIKQAMAEVGCWAHFLTGSGSAYVGIARSGKQANRIARFLAGKEMGTVLATSSC